MSDSELKWCGVPVVVRDDVPHDEFIMPLFDLDPGQQPTFTVTQATLDLVMRDFEGYRPSIEQMLYEWREKKVDFIVAVARGAKPTRPLDEV
ncbi:MAG TPA: hypothetical protein VD966_06805 [Pyrinomonadaceae bacterium]|nr:hypothetical protein [Pyrinomonadaceae bacterium]